jgi:hypothetical protein
MANTYIIQRTRVVRIHKWIRTRAHSETDALSSLDQKEFEVDDTEVLDELPAGEASEGAVIIDVEEVKDDY